MRQKSKCKTPISIGTHWKLANLYIFALLNVLILTLVNGLNSVKDTVTVNAVDNLSVKDSRSTEITITFNGDDNKAIQSQNHNRSKRQVIYYICGRYPHQFYSTTMCPRCTNNGQDLNSGCTSAVQCVSLYSGTTACINGRCCTADDSGIIDGGLPQFDSNSPTQPVGPGQPIPPLNPYDPYNPYNTADPQFGASNSMSYGYCSKGERSNIRCSAAGQCPIQQICLNGLCCPRTASDYAHSCGGQMALAVCEGGMCPNGLICTPSNFCCQCPSGRSGGRCNQGVCAPGYRCNVNGYCCAACADMTTPYGECADGKACGGGAKCQSAGEICCFQP